MAKDLTFPDASASSRNPPPRASVYRRHAPLAPPSRPPPQQPATHLASAPAPRRRRRRSPALRPPHRSTHEPNKNRSPPDALRPSRKPIPSSPWPSRRPCCRRRLGRQRRPRRRPHAAQRRLFLEPRGSVVLRGAPARHAAAVQRRQRRHHDQTPLAERIVKGAGFDGFEPAFAKRLCAADGRTPVTSYAKALKLVTEEGRALWRAAVDRPGAPCHSAGALPASDDRMLYWTRLYMTRTLRQWAPSFRLGKAQAQALQWRFERASRGQLDIDLPRRYAADGSRYRRMIISGFDVFTLGTPGTANTGLRNGNPSGATALALDGREFRLADGSLLRIEAYLLPVSYDPFNRGMQEDTLGPWFRPGPRRVDASITISQGGANQFWLEAWNGRFHGSSAGNDGIVYCPADSALPNYASPGQRDQSRHRTDFPAGLRLQYQPAAPLARLRQRQPLAAEPAGAVLLATGPPVARRRYLARHRAAAGRYQPGRGRLRRHLAHQLRLLPRLRQPAHRKRADQRGDERHARSLPGAPAEPTDLRAQRRWRRLPVQRAPTATRCCATRSAWRFPPGTSMSR